MKCSTPQTKWTAASAGDSIVIVTTDARFDAFVREASKHEAYELVTVADFESRQAELINTSLAIEYVQQSGVTSTLCFLKDTEGWQEYPIFGVDTIELAEHRRQLERFACYPGKYEYDLMIGEDDDPAYLVEMARRMINICGEPDPQAYRI